MALEQGMIEPFVDNQVRNGVISAERLDDAVRRVLGLKAKLDLPGKQARGELQRGAAAFLAEHEETSIYVPQWGPVRSLNLSNVVAVVVYETRRQLEGGLRDGKGRPDVR